MPSDATETLEALLATIDADGLPLHLGWLVRLDLVRERMLCGNWEGAANLLKTLAPTTPEQRRELAGQWLVLARDGDEHIDIQDALRHAVDADPEHARPALARYRQRQKQWSQAADEWRAVIAANPLDFHPYLSLASSYEKLGLYEQALATYLQLTNVAPTARSYLTVAPRLAELGSRLPDVSSTRRIRVALLSNATLDHLASYVNVECYRAGLRPTVYQAGFDQVTQEILDSRSGLYEFEPDVVICALHASRLFPRLHPDPFGLSIGERRAEVTRGLADLEGLLDALTQRTSALVLVHNVVTPQHPALGILDWRDELGQSELFGDMNRRLAELVRSRYRSVYVVDEDQVQSRVGKAHATDARLWLTAGVAWGEAVHLRLAREYLRYVRPLRGLASKCVVLDLDNTLWGGVVGEDGIEGIQLGPNAPGNAFVAFQRELDQLWRRGILLAICSKNNLDDVTPAFERHPSMVLTWAHIAAHRINWQSKAENLRELASELHIGLDSLVFLDDNPVERAVVRSELPEVLVPELPSDPAQYRSALLELDVFESLGLTNEDRERGHLYAEQAQRRAFETSARASSLEDYLAGLQMVVDIAPARPADVARLAQLTNKTNQFNLTTRRYTEADVVAMLADGWNVIGLRVSDRFGDNGLVGLAIVTPGEAGVREIDTLLLSCRVMGRGVESALLGFVADQARASGITRLRGRFIPTPKNTPARECFPSCGFSLIDRAEAGEEVWELDLTHQAVPVAPWLRMPLASTEDAALASRG
ncbi:MAG: HAD-IIIC family phosphatase [Chloroflexota bacterium]